MNRSCLVCGLPIDQELWDADPTTRQHMTHPACPTPEQHLQALIEAGQYEQAEAFGDRWDSAGTADQPSLAVSALWYASIGLSVFPLQPGAKLPYPGSHGFKDATIDAEQIKRWWEVAPQSNIGIATGLLVDVIDVDGVAGVQSWQAATDLPPIIGHVLTPRPYGHHLYVRATGEGNNTETLPGVDYRGLGGYVVAPPSFLATSPERTYSGYYRWLNIINLEKETT